MGADVSNLVALIYQIDRAVLETGVNGEEYKLDAARKDFAIELMSVKRALRMRFGSWLDG